MTTPTHRLHALDNLRAIMMWLGIVLHVAVNHLVTKSPLPWHDRDRSQFADLIVVFIHAFRMPVFFILAGFFVAMLVSRRGYGGMLRHRLRRIGLPFAVFWPFIFIGTSVLVMAYVHLMARGTIGLDRTLIVMEPSHPMINTMHLWFIYYLLWFSVLTAVAGLLGKYLADSTKESISAFWKTLASKWWGFIVLALPLAIVGASFPGGLVPASGSFLLNINEIVQSGLFFVVGWHVYRYQEQLLGLYSKHCWRYAIAGLAFFISYLALVKPAMQLGAQTPYLAYLLAYLYTCTTWLWSFALIGLFLRYLPNQNRLLRYISDSSYWVYLVHMLGTIGFGILLYNTPFGAMGKMALNILATTIACIVTYHLFVRYTPISTLLNGHRFSFATGKAFEKKVVPG